MKIMLSCYDLNDLLSCQIWWILGMLNGSRKTGNRFLIRWPVCKVRNRLSKSFVNVLCIYILLILINDFYCLRVSADADAPAAITINSNLTQRLKHMVHVSAWTRLTTNEAGISIHVPPAVQTAGVTRVDIKGTPPPSTLRGASITDTRGKCLPACQRDRPAVEVWLCLVLSSNVNESPSRRVSKKIKAFTHIRAAQRQAL